jgi:EAL and modified HD-GYP domain-containing signal transduction protein
MKVFLARQPIFDRALKVCGYELLYRSCASGGFDGSDPTLASMQVLSNSLFGFGLDKLLAGKLGFVNFPRELLVTGIASVLPAKSLVIEILESVDPDDAVIAACRALKEKGFMLALDDVDPRTPSLRLAELVNVIKVDFRATTPSDRQLLIRRYAKPALMLAEKVETQAEFLQAQQEGFTYYQGYFFARPLILPREEIPACKLNYLRLMTEIYCPELEFGQIENLIKHEVSLCQRLLRYVNSAAFSWRVPIASIRQALVLLGENEMRRWISLAALPVLSSDRPDQLVESAVLRARFCELIAPWARLPARHSELFLMGMFSLLDVMTGRPLAELLEELHLAPDIRDALLGNLQPADRLAQVYALVLACERADWESVSLTAHQLGMPAEVVSDLYLEAVNWCAEILPAPDGARLGDPSIENRAACV